jgi:drug/metabolite transporter (DMT)-like permease
MSEQNKGHIAILFTNLIFGCNTPITKSILSQGSVNAMSLTYFRFLGAAIVFWVASLFIKAPKASKKDVLLLIFASLFGVIMNQFLFVVGLSKTTPVNASIIVSLTPIITMIFAALFIKEPITWKKVLGVMVGCTGALLLILTSASKNSSSSNSSVFGLILCLLSSVSYAAYLTLFQKLIKRNHPVTIMKWEFLTAAILVLPICLPSISQVEYSQLSLSLYLRIGYVVLFATFLSYLLIPIGQARLRPTTLSMYNYIQPVVTTLLAVIMGLDVFTIYKLIACLLVFLGVYIVTKSKSKAQLIEQQKAQQTLKTLIKK